MGLPALRRQPNGDNDTRKRPLSLPAHLPRTDFGIGVFNLILNFGTVVGAKVMPRAMSFGIIFALAPVGGDGREEAER